jgi:hypothetical protein
MLTEATFLAQAMRELRRIHINGDWNDFQEFMLGLLPEYEQHLKDTVLRKKR